MMQNENPVLVPNCPPDLVWDGLTEDATLAQEWDMWLEATFDPDLSWADHWL